MTMLIYKLGRGREEEKHRENGEKVVGLHQEQAEDDPLVEEERRRRGSAERDKLSDRQRSRSAYSISGMDYAC